jgi:DNA invertase Pin-like site-specific DNA recombinase
MASPRPDITPDAVEPLRKKGMAWRKIARELHCSDETLQSRRKEWVNQGFTWADISKPGRPLDIAPDVVKSLREKGVSWGKIARKLHCGDCALKSRRQEWAKQGQTWASMVPIN